MEKIGAEPEDEGEEIAGEIHFPIFWFSNFSIHQIGY